MGLLNVACNDECGLKTTVAAYHFWKCPENPSEFLKEAHGILWIVLFVNPMYCTVLIDQSLALNRRKNDKEVDPDSKGQFESDVSRFYNQDYPPDLRLCNNVARNHGRDGAAAQVHHEVSILLSQVVFHSYPTTTNIVEFYHIKC
ncbi:hypothetical protein CEXT_158961 [Caerostris extrusa]|uniref:Uncharacterized protein n=1 Tax=Caerostris extrusa TaxID=172846 RepID=A0AAV4VYV3_CAEEX|nr:hypothetical protein CEXT_158961 [Caerostris extrusa]